jgi:hypothetical protein
MKKMFYSHLVETKDLEIELDSLDLKREEKDELLHHVHGSIHLKILDTVLSELSEDDKKKLVEHINNDDHGKIWEHLLRTLTHAEEKVRNAAGKVVNEFRDEIGKLKKV